MPKVSAVSVSPTCAVPPIVGPPVAGVLGRAATVAVAALVSALVVARVVGEANLHLDGVALVGVYQGVGGILWRPGCLVSVLPSFLIHW